MHDRLAASDVPFEPNKYATVIGIAIVVWAAMLYWSLSGMRYAPLDIPMVYDGDGLQYGYIIDSFARAGGLSHIDNAGAPFGTQNIDFPNGDFANMAIAAILFSGGYGIGYNLFLLVSVILTTAAGYLVALRCRLEPPWAAVAALAFSLLPFHFFRMGHLFYTNYATAAVALWLCLRISKPFLSRSNSTRKKLLALAGISIAAIWCGTTGVYYAFFTCIILAAAAVFQVARSRDFRPAARALACIVIVVASLGVQMVPTIVNNRTSGDNPTVAKRAALESDLYGLRMAQLLLPVQGHRLPSMAKLRSDYDSQAWHPNENGTATLGMLGSAGFVLALLMLLFPVLRARFPWPLQLSAGLMFVLFLYATMGGIGSVFAVTVSPQLRALNRVSPFIALLCILVSAGALQLVGNVIRRNFPSAAWASPVLSMGMLVFVILDQTSQATKQSSEARDGTRLRYEADANFAAELSSKLKNDSLIFQLPYISYPENPELMGSYAQFRNNLHAPEFKWTHGAMKGRPESNWLTMVSALPAEEFSKVIASTGFTAVVVDLRADLEASEAKRAAFEHLTSAKTFTDVQGTQKASVATHAAEPTARAMAAAKGWQTTIEVDGPRRWLWSLDNPTFILTPAADNRTCESTLQLSALQPMDVTVKTERNVELLREKLIPGQLKEVTFRVPAQSKSITLANGKPAINPGPWDPRMLAIQWMNHDARSLTCTYVKE